MVLRHLHRGLIVSFQPLAGGAVDRDEVVAFALAALAGGAAGLRIAGVANVAAVRAATDAPIIGLVERELPDSPVRVTPYIADLVALAVAGADVVAFDATRRPRPAKVR
jgi:putative N-acetylmannosamine-6-phosphate epimerase